MDAIERDIRANLERHLDRAVRLENEGRWLSSQMALELALEYEGVLEDYLAAKNLQEEEWL